MGAAGLGAIVGGINDTIGGAASFGLAQKNSKIAWRRQKRVLQNGIQWRVADLRAAGLNPILAASSGLGAGGAPPPIQPGSADLSHSNAATNAFRAGQEKKKISAGVKQAESQATANSAIAANQAAQARLADVNAVLSGQKNKTESTLQNYYIQQANQSASNSRVADENANLLRARLPEMRAQAEIWEDESMKRVMQWRHIFFPSGGGANINFSPRRGAGPIPEGNKGPRKKSILPRRFKKR